METVHLPPVLVFTADAALDLLRAHGLVCNLSGWRKRGCATPRWWRSRSAPSEERDEAASRCCRPRCRRVRHHYAAQGAASAAVARKAIRVAGKPRQPEAAAEAAPDPRVAARRRGDGGRGGRRVPPPRRRGRGAASRAGHRTALKPGWRADFRNWRDNVASAPTVVGLGAVLPLLPERAGAPSASCCPLRARRRRAGGAAAGGGAAATGLAPALFVLGEQRIALSARRAKPFESVNFLFGMGETDSDWPNAHFGAEVAAFGKGAAAADALGLLAGMDAVLNTHALPAHALMARLKGIGVRTFCGLHLVERTQWGNPLGTAHTALAYEHAYDGITVISEKLRRWCIAQGVPADKLHLIRNAPGYAADPARVAAAVSARRARPPGKLRALFLGAWTGRRGWTGSPPSPPARSTASSGAWWGGRCWTGRLTSA
jgi:hypothetical protein